MSSSSSSSAAASSPPKPVSWTLATVLVVATLAAGTVSTILTKLLYQWKATGDERCGSHYIKKPYFATLLMFIGELMCLGLYKGMRQWQRRRGGDGGGLSSSGSGSNAKLHAESLVDADYDHERDTGILGVGAVQYADDAAVDAAHRHGGVVVGGGGGGVDTRVRPPWYYFLGFCSFDLTATLISGIGLLWVDASLYQMLRGGTVVFAALASKLLLRQRFSRRHLVGLTMVVTGLVVVGVSGVLRDHYDPKPKEKNAVAPPSHAHVLVGIGLIVLSSALQGTQSVLEMKYMKMSDRYTVEPLELVGWEGVFGTLLCAALLLPIAQHIDGPDCGHAEDTLDTLYMLRDNVTVVVIMVVYTFNIALFNTLSNTVSKLLSAVHRQLINASRTVTIWGVELVLYYRVRPTLGEDWTRFSFMQLAGFVLLLSGSLVYGLAKKVA